MNLLLLEATELELDNCVTVRDRRATHLLKVLKVTAGSLLRVGLIDGSIGQGEVHQCGYDWVTLHCSFQKDSPPAAADVLLIAMPRPKVLARCLEHATSLGFGLIAVFRARQCVKSHFESHLLQPEHIHAHLIAGLEQSRRTRLPQVKVFPRFRPFVEDELNSLITPSNRYLADADAATALHETKPQSAAVTLVIGPEGGLIPHEIDMFGARDFQLVNAGPHPLRVEAALSFVTGQLVALRGRQAHSQR